MKRRGADVFLVTDQALGDCTQTIIQKALREDASSPDEPDAWVVEEYARVAWPPGEACAGPREARRPGSLRMRGGAFELRVQRSVWCQGWELTRVFERAPAEPLEDDEVIRRYVAYFGRGDALLLAGLFAEAGSLLEPFTRTDTGDPFRHDGRAAVQRWFAEAFRTAPWRAMKLENVRQREEPGQYDVDWSYMDPRLSSPLLGRTRLTIAAGEIFEATVALSSEPAERAEPVAPSGDSAASGARSGS